MSSVLPGQDAHSAPDLTAQLYHDDRISVSPSWLSIDNARYSIRTVVRLEYASTPPQLGIAYSFFFGAIVLIAYSFYQFTKSSLPTVVPWIMLLGSVAILLYSAFVIFSSKTRHQITVTLLDGGQVPIVVGKGEQAQSLLDGLTRAMDWHLNRDFPIATKRGSHVRQAIASSGKAAAAAKVTPATTPIYAADNTFAVSNGSKAQGIPATSTASAPPDIHETFDDAPEKRALYEMSSGQAFHRAITDPKQHPSRVVRKWPSFVSAILKRRN